MFLISDRILAYTYRNKEIESKNKYSSKPRANSESSYFLVVFCLVYLVVPKRTSGNIVLAIVEIILGLSVAMPTGSRTADLANII